MILYRVQWSQPYTAWPKPKEELDITQARAVLARIMIL